MKTKVTAVSIVEKTIPQELQILIEETAIKAYEYGITHKELVVELDIAREKHKRSKSICPIKDDKFSEFRLKTEKFFSNPDLLPIGNLAFNDYRFEFANYHVEAMCSAYKLFKANVPLTIANIYDNAKSRMSVSDFYIDMRKRLIGNRENVWHLTSKKENIQGLKNYFEALTKDLLLSNKDLNKDCNRFLFDYDYSASEEVWLKMIYLICNS